MKFDVIFSEQIMNDIKREFMLKEFNISFKSYIKLQMKCLKIFSL